MQSLRRIIKINNVIADKRYYIGSNTIITSKIAMIFPKNGKYQPRKF